MEIKLTNLTDEKQRTANTGLAKVAVQCSADTFVVNQSLVLRINFCGKIRHCAKRQNEIESNTLRFTVFPFKISEIWRGFKADFRFKPF
jgi:hypothetical protein